MIGRRKQLESICTYMNETARRDHHTHAGLWLDKFIASQDRNETSSRADLVQQVTDIPEPEMYRLFYQRWTQTLAEKKIVSHEASVEGRMIIGLGNESVLETSVTLHRTYGVPYIPGSALKGLAASYVQRYLNTDEQWKQVSEDHPAQTAQTILFGNGQEAGYITFMDALYVPGSGHQGRVLYPDIITVHHQKYYQGTTNAAPTDWDNPIPVPFLSATGRYLIALAAPELEQSNAWITLAFKILAGALKELGIGAKTSSGYGRMSIVDIQPIEISKPTEGTTTQTIAAEPPEDLIAGKIERYIREVNNLSKVDGSIKPYYGYWFNLQSHPKSQELAIAIIKKITLGGGKKTKESLWFKDLLKSLEE
jgi:CRISPR-associated protein Cmr6